MGASKICVIQVLNLTWGYNKIVTSQNVFQGHSYHYSLPTAIDRKFLQRGGLRNCVLLGQSYYGFFHQNGN